MGNPERVAGRYELEAVLGAGSFSVVWSAVDTLTGERVAVKMGRPAFGQNPQEAAAREELRREAAVLARLVHPNIIRVRSAGEHDGRPYLVMDYLEGRTLREAIQSGQPLDEDAVVDMGASIARALAAAHERGILHNDLKPENIVLVSGEPVLIDFGVARDLNATLLPADASIVSGTLAYLAPELLAGSPASPASEIYALAATLFECLVGRAPRPGEVPSLGAMSPALAGVLGRALSVSPQRRFGSALEFGRALRTGRQPTLRIPLPAAARSRRTRRPVKAAALLGLALAGLGLAALLLGEGARRPGGEAARTGSDTAAAGNPTRVSGTPTATIESAASPQPTETPEPGLLEEARRSIGEGLAGAGERAGRALEAAGRETLDGLSEAGDEVGHLLDRGGEEIEQLAERWGLD